MNFKLVQFTERDGIKRIATFDDEADANLAKKDREATGMKGLKVRPTTSFALQHYRKGTYVPKIVKAD